MPKLRKLAKDIKKTTQAEERHTIAQKLWDSNVHEARILAGFVDEPNLVTELQMESWVLDFDDWAVTDGVCSNLFDRTKFAWKKANEWSKREEEFVKRAGFVIMAALSVHNKQAKDEEFYPFLKAIKREATDERNFVKKAVNWALRQIGKSRTQNLYNLSLATAKEIKELNSKSAKWIAADTIRELESEKIKKRLGVD